MLGCGSDDGWVYLWELGGTKPGGGKKDGCYCAFQAHEGGAATAVAFLAPEVCAVQPSSSGAGGSTKGGGLGGPLAAAAAAGGCGSPAGLISTTAAAAAAAAGDYPPAASSASSSSTGLPPLPPPAWGAPSPTTPGAPTASHPTAAAGAGGTPRSAACSEGGAGAMPSPHQAHQQQQQWVLKPREATLRQVVVTGGWNGGVRVWELHGRPGGSSHPPGS
jgi:hypothetical protein